MQPKIGAKQLILGHLISYPVVEEMDIALDENDSSLGDDVQSDTTTLNSTLLNHRQILGRTYHKLRGEENAYWGPNDEQQNDQLDIGHHMLTLLLGDKLYLAPIKEDCNRVLDLGTGTGIWAIDFADAHPAAEVTGIDLSPIQPSWVPPNCKFIIDDITQPGSFSGSTYDFVHLRCLMGSIEDWPGLYKTIIKSLERDGWIQHVEMSILFESDDGTVKEGHVMRDWSDLFIKFGEDTAKSLTIARDCADLMREAGFEDVQSKWYKVPIGSWPKDPTLKQIGFWNFFYCYQGCEGWALYPLTYVLGWSEAEVRLYVERFRRALENRNNHAYYRVVAAWGKKPSSKST